jgi:tetraprenyl-beta-curcumene synthase
LPARLNFSLDPRPRRPANTIARAGGALALMSARYWTTVVPTAHRQLRRWHGHAQAMPDPALRRLALTKLTDERFNVYFAPTFATLAPHERRTITVEAIVALQVIYDYLDGLTEQPVSEPLRNGKALFHALTNAVSSRCEPHHDYYRHHPHWEDGGYLQRLVATARSALANLPARVMVAEVAGAAAARCAEAQARAHAVARLGVTQLEHWAIDQTAHDGQPWREFLAGAASAVISMHALIAAAADPRTTPEQAARIEAFHRSTCLFATILDGLIDLEQDERSGEAQLGYLRYFPDRDLLSTRLVDIARRAVKEAHHIPHGGHHVMTLAGVVAYYTAALGRRENSSKAIVAPLQHELQPLIAPTLAFMRAGRFAKRLFQSRSATAGTPNHGLERER